MCEGESRVRKKSEMKNNQLFSESFMRTRESIRTEWICDEFDVKEMDADAELYNGKSRWVQSSSCSFNTRESSHNSLKINNSRNDF